MTKERVVQNMYTLFPSVTISLVARARSIASYLVLEWKVEPMLLIMASSQEIRKRNKKN